MRRHLLESFHLLDYFKWLDHVSQRRLVVPATPFELGLRPYLALQHDVDLSLDWAVQLAHAEEQRGYTATYAVMVGADTYDVTSSVHTQNLRQIVSLGHRLALHFDWKAYAAMGLTIEQGINRDKRILDALDFHVEGIAPHKPFRNGVPDLGIYQNALIGNYNSRSEVYVSDSGGGFRDSAIETLHNMPDYVRLCTHPCWWLAWKPGMHPMDRRQAVVRDAVRLSEARLGAFLASWDFSSHPGAIEHDRRSTLPHYMIGAS